MAQPGKFAWPSGARDRLLDEPVDHGAQRAGGVGAGRLRFVPDRQLAVGAGPLGEDASRALDLRGAAELGGVFRDKAEQFRQQLVARDDLAYAEIDQALIASVSLGRAIGSR